MSVRVLSSLLHAAYLRAARVEAERCPELTIDEHYEKLVSSCGRLHAKYGEGDVFLVLDAIAERARCS